MRGPDAAIADYLRKHDLKKWFADKLEALIVAQPEDPIKHLCESINEEVERRTAPAGKGGNGAGSFANEGKAMIRGSLTVCGRDGRRRRLRIERHANKDMTTGARGALMLRSWSQEIQHAIADALVGAPTAPGGVDPDVAPSQQEAEIVDLTQRNGDAQAAGDDRELRDTPEGAAGGEGDASESFQEQPDDEWMLDPDVEDRLENVYAAFISGTDDGPLSEILYELGISGDSFEIAKGGDMPLEQFRGLLLSEWRVCRRMQAISAHSDSIIRSICQAIPGGSPADPVSALRGMSREEIGRWAADIAAPGVAERMHCGILHVANSTRKDHDAATGGGSGNANVTSGKFAMLVGAAGERMVCKFGHIEEFYQGLSSKIGLPELRLLEGMEAEHTRRQDSRASFSPGNYEIVTTPSREWCCVTDESLAKEVSVGPRIVRAWADILQGSEAKLAGLTKVEIIALQLYSGPMYVKYNACLRGFPQSVVADLANNTYTTTITCIVSGIIKLSRCMVMPKDRVVYRGLGDMDLPDEFKNCDETGIRGGVEYAMMSTTLEKNVALQYASSESQYPTLLEIKISAISRGASIMFLSQYPGETEILYPPLSYLEVVGDSRFERLDDGSLAKIVPLEVCANVSSSTIEQILGRRKALHVSMLEHRVHEVRDALHRRLESDKAKNRLRMCPYTARFDHHLLLAQSIIEEAEGLVREHKEGRSDEWYNDERCYDSAVKDGMALFPMSVQKFDMWVEEKTMLAEVLSKRSIKWVTRRRMSELNRKLYTSLDTGAGKHASFLAGVLRTPSSLLGEKTEDSEVRRIALDLCMMRGAVVRTVDEVNSAGEPPIVTAAGLGDRVSLKLLVVAGCDVNARCRDDSATALHMACFMGFESCVRYLVGVGSDLEAETELKETCMYHASQNGHFHVVEYLLELEAGRGLTMICTDFGWSCAYVAAANGRVRTLKALLGSNAQEQLQMRTKAGFSCAHGAALNGHHDILRTLHEVGGSRALAERCNRGATCAYVAIEKGHIDTLQVIIDISRDPDGGAGLLATRDDGWSFFHEAASSAQVEIIRLLDDFEKGGGDIGGGLLKSTNGITSLHAAVIRKDICEHLLHPSSNGIPFRDVVQACLKRMSLHKQSSLGKASFVDPGDIAGMDLGRVASSGSADDDAKASLRRSRGLGSGTTWCLLSHREMECPRVETCKFLCEAGGRGLLEAEDGDGHSLLHYLCDLGEVAQAELLAKWAGCPDLFAAVMDQVDREWEERDAAVEGRNQAQDANLSNNL